MRTIMVIRHGEKPDATGRPGGVDAFGIGTPHGLVPRGWARARKLADLLSEPPVRAPFVRPSALFAPDFGSAEKQHRPYLTLIPTCQALELPIQDPKPEGKEDKLAKLLVHGDEPSPLVCWEHHHIPALAGELAAALGIRSLTSNCHSWPENDFSTALVFSEQPSGWQLAQVSEALLPGDPPA